MNTNPALASILDNLRDCNRAYVNTLHRIKESAQEAAYWARTSPYAADLSTNHVINMARLHGQRTVLVDAAYYLGATEEQIKIVLGGDMREFYALHDILTGADESQSQA